MSMNPFFIYRNMLIALLLLILTASGILSQNRVTTSKPSGFNSWKPTFLLPKTTDNPGPDSVVRTDFTITLRDGVVIEALKFVPVRPTPPAGGYLTVIMVHGYGDNKNTLAQFCQDQASYGYYTMTFSVRGQGNSGGLSNLISDVEALDLLEIIQWIKNDSANGSNPNEILIMGGSQGGLLPMKALCMGGNPVTTIISSVAPPNFASGWIENGSIKMTFLWTIDYTPDTARYTPEVDNMRSWVFADTKAGWDNLYRTLPIGRDFVSQLPNCQTPVMIEATWQDKFFNAQGWLDNIATLNVPLTSYMGAVHGHGGEQSYNEDIWHMDWFNNWFYQWLWNMPTPILDQAKYQYAYTTFPLNNGVWSFVHDSSSTPLKTSTTNMRLYFNENKKLLNTYNSNNNNKYSFKNTIGSGYSLQQAIYDEFTGTTFKTKFKVDTSLVFLSNPLTQPLKWAGTPKIKLDYMSSASTFCQYNFEIYEVTSTGQQRFINRANYTDRNYTKNSRRQVTFNGQGHSHMFQAGSRIKIKLTNLDRVIEDTEFFGPTNPFVLPVMKNGTNNIYVSNNCYIELPIKSNAAGVHGLFAEETDVTNNEPYTFSLSQNFPNPFNPSTMIEYTIAKNEQVQLTVYDLLGREVKTLVNEMQVPGSYNVTFNAQSLSSGIYFYRISTASFTDVKRMVLVK